MRRSIWGFFFLIAIAGCDGCFGCGDGENPSLEDLTLEDCDNGEDDNGDSLVDCEDARCQLEPSCFFEPGDPAAAAPDVTANMSFYDSVRFLWEADNPVIRGVEADAVDPATVVVLRARILDREGQPVEGVRAYIAGEPQFGYTYSRADGMVDLVANGGRSLSVRTQAAGFLPVDRRTDAPTLDYAPVSDIVVTALDERSARMVDGGTLRASTVEDQDGARAARIWFPRGTVATAHLPDGQRGDLDEFTVRLSEYTFGDAGPDAMPAFLPENTGYTYAVEMSIDEAEAAGAEEVTFNKTGYLYLDNFLEFDVGTTVPSGYYSRSRQQWEATPDGQVIARVSGGFDLDGSGSPAPDSALESIGMSGEEEDALASLFEVGEVFWRAPVDHFSPQDLNWGVELPPDAVDPSEIPDLPTRRDDDPCAEAGSIIECQNRTIMKVLPVPGTGASLVYRSDRTEGRGKSFTLGLTNDFPPASLKSIEVEVKVQGQTFEESLEPEPNLEYTFEWDGLDSYGRKIPQAVPVEIAVGFTYEAEIRLPTGTGESFGQGGQAGQTLRPARIDVTRWARHRDQLGAYDAQAALNMGGWALSGQHAYDGDRQKVYPANAPEFGSADVSRVIRNIEDFQDDAVPLNDDETFVVLDLMVGSDDSLYIVGFSEEFALNALVLKRSPDGTLEHIAGARLSQEAIFTSPCLLQGECGEGGPALDATLVGNTWAISADDDLYFTDGTCVRRIRDGILERFGGQSCGNETNEGFPDVELMDVAPDGALIVHDDGVLYRIDEGGDISLVAGCTDCDDDDELTGLSGPRTSRIDADHLVLDLRGNIRYFDRDGRLIELRGDTLHVVLNEDGARVQSARTGRDGAIYFLEESSSGGSLLKRYENGGVQTIAGAERDLYDPENVYLAQRALTADNIPATNAFIFGTSPPAATRSGAVYFASFANFEERGNEAVLKEVANAFPSSIGDDQALIASRSGTRGFVFDGQGRISETRSLDSGVTIRRYEYDEDGLSSVFDRSGNETRIERDGDGNLAAITGPYGHRTTFTLDDDGYIASAAYEDGSSIDIESTRGLITRWTDQLGRTTEYSWADDGGFLRLDDPDGGWKQLIVDGSTTFLETSSGRVDAYETTSAFFESSSLRSNALGQEWQRTRGFDGVSNLTEPDGTTRSVVKTGDPRFGLQSPYVSLRTTRTPSGLEQRMERTKEVELADERDKSSVTRVVETVTTNGATWTYEWDALARTFTSTSPEGRTIVEGYDELLRRISMQVGNYSPGTVEYDANGRPTTYRQGSLSASATYDERGNIGTVTDTYGVTTDLSYDDYGRLAAMTFGSGRTYSIAYDAAGKPATVAPGSGQSYAETYNANGMRTSLTHPSGATDRFTWDIDRKLQSVDLENGDSATFESDVLGRQSGMTTSRGTFSREFDDATGNLVRATSPESEMRMEYDGFLVEAMTSEFEGQSHRIDLEHDSNFRIASQTLAGTTIDWTYDLDGLPVEVGPASYGLRPDAPVVAQTTIGNMQVDYSYDDIGRPTTVTYRNGNDVVYAQNYDYGSGTRVASISEEFEGAATTRDFEYDVDGRLTGVNVDGSATTFTYDDRGNRTTVVAGAATYDSSDRIVSAGPRTYSVDASGWVSGWTEAGQTTSLEYDGRDLISANVNGTVTTYGYDSMGRRVWRKVDGAFDRGWLYGRDNVPVAEVDGSGNVVSRFVYVTSDFTPDFMLRDGTTYMFVRDQVGSIRGVVDTSSGAVVQRIDYDALGRVTGDTNPGFQPFGFAGGLYDEATGLVRLGARDYDPYTGRWTSPDPRLFAGGPNLYAYAANDPVNIVDPRGEIGFAALIKPAIIAGVAIAGAGTAGLMADNLNHWGTLVEDSNRRANESRGRLGLERIDAENAMRHCIWQCASSRRYGTTLVSKAAGAYHESILPNALGGAGLNGLPGQPGWDDRVKDEHNNTCGQQNASKPGECQDLCQKDFEAGRLATDANLPAIKAAREPTMVESLYNWFQ